MSTDPFGEPSFTQRSCFLCSTPLADETSREHVFPQWLLHKFDLWDRSVTLLNGTRLPYRDLKVPCCTSCNTNYLSRVEKTIQTALKDGFRAFCSLPELIVYQWVGKIAWGMLFRELNLHVDRKEPSQGTITTPEFLQELKLLHNLLQSVRRPMRFDGFTAWSLFLLETHDYSGERGFGYHDTPLSAAFALRLGPVGIICVLDDRGIQKELYGNLFEEFHGGPLHPIQFDELVAKVSYRAHLLKKNPTYLFLVPEEADGEVLVVSPPPQGLSTEPFYPYRDWSQEEYARCLFHYMKKWGVSFEDLYRPPDMVFSIVTREDGSVIHLPPGFYFEENDPSTV